MTTTLEPPATASPRLTPRHRAAIAAAVTVVLWASAFVAIRWIGDAYAPGALASGRITLAAVALVVIAVVRRRHPRQWPRGRALALIACYGVAWFAAYMVVLNQAQRHLDAGTAAMLVNLAPILVAVLAGVLLAEGFSRWLLTGVGVAFAGTVVIATGGTGGGSVNEGIGVLLGLITALLYAAGVLTQKVALRTVDVFTATLLGAVIGAITLSPYSVQFVQQSMDAPVAALAAVVYLGIFPTAVAFTLWAYALARTDAGRLTATTLAVPAVAVALSWLVLDELPTGLGLLGGALCLLGVAISRRRRAAPPGDPMTSRP